VSAFRDLLGDPEADASADDYGTPRLNIGAPEDIKRQVLQTEIPETTPEGITGFASNFAHDVGRFASGMGALLGEVVVHPVKSVEAVAGAVVHPIDTMHTLADPIIDKYTPRPDESVPGMLARNAYDHPFDTLIDASTILQGPFGVAGKAAEMAGAVNLANKLRTVAEIGKAIDPISIAQKTGTYALKTVAPDALARLRIGDATAEAGATEKARQDFLMHDFNTKLQAAEQDIQPDGSVGPLALTPAEKAIRFAYGEGRVQLNPEAQAITELTHRGEFEKRAMENGSAIRQEALDKWVEAWKPLQADYEKQAGIDPETYAANARDSALLHRSHMPDGTPNPDFNPMDPANAKAAETAYNNGLTEATERQARRATVSTRTALDVQKETAFRTKAANLLMEQHTFDAQEINSMLPRAMPTTVDEALEVMGPKGGIIIPHSMEVLTREQSTISGTLDKLRESNVYSENLGARFRAGELQHLDPAAALSRYYKVAIHGKSIGNVARDAAEESIKNGWGYVERMPAGWTGAHDADLAAGTHQILHPASLHLDGMVQEHFDRVASRLYETAAAGEAASGAVNLGDLAQGMAEAAQKTYPWNKEAAGEVYKITKGFGDELAFYKKSFDPTTNPLAQFSDKAVMGPFNMVNLNLKVGRLMNNMYGNTEFITMQGLHPFSARGLMALATTGRALLGRAGILQDEVSKNLAGIFHLPGVASGGLSASEAFAKVTDLSGKMAASANPVARGVGKWATLMSHANQEMESIYRAGSTIYEMTPKGMGAVQNLLHGSAAMADMADNLSRLRGMGVEAMTDEGLKSAVTGMNRWMHNYDRTSALDRNVGRYVFPYYKFYRHSAELLLRYPFEKPLQAQLARAVGQRALQDIKDTSASMGFDWNTMVPESMRDSIPLHVALGSTGKPDTLVMLNTKGPNPFSFLTTGDPGTQFIAGLHPLAKIAIEQATGTNLFTHEKFQGPLSTFNGRTVDENGAVVEDYNRPNLAEHYMRQFWPYQAVEEMVKNGRSAKDTADMIDMLRNNPGTFRLDERGMQARKPMALGPATPLARFVGMTPSTVEAPNQKQRAAEAAGVSSEFDTLLQQHPERRDLIMKKMRDAIANRQNPDVPLLRR
jgi:hypothetical protein